MNANNKDNLRMIIDRVLVLFLILINTGHIPAIGSNFQSDSLKAFDRNKNIGRGINFGNALEAPTEGEWGMVIMESYVQAVADAGFNSVRLPICWSAHTSQNYPYSIDAAFLQRVDQVVDWCLDRNLAVIITIHHFNDLYNYPDNQVYQSMFFAIWRQLTIHFLGVDHEKLFFEVLNEPEVNLTADKWNLLMPWIIDSVRVRDNDRTLIIDAPDYGSHTSLNKLIIPQDEKNVIVSTRYYLPYQFAQQGAWWSTWTDLNQYLGTTWTESTSEKNTVLSDMLIIKNWAQTNKRPVTIGEWGSIMFADNQSRVTWTNYVRRQFEKNGFSWSYFDFGVVFKAYSIAESRWLDGFVEALTGDNTSVSDGRVSDSTGIRPARVTNRDSLTVISFIRIPDFCGKTDSVKKTVQGSTIKITTYHPEHFPQGNSINSCPDTVKLGKFAAGNYTLIFDCQYIDKVNSVHYSIRDTINFSVSGITSQNNIESTALKVYPVPANYFIVVDNLEASSNFMIYDLNGSLRRSGKYDYAGINISDLMAGEYILRIAGSDFALNKKFVIIH